MDMISEGQHVAQHEAARSAAQAGGEFLTFRLGAEEYGIDILRVRLGCAEAQYNHFTVVIVLNVKGRVVGAVVDSVSDVLELTSQAIKPAPEMAAAIDTSFITGIGSIKTDNHDRMLILMDIEALMASADMGIFSDRHH